MSRKQYSMNDGMSVAKKASNDIEQFLYSKAETVEVLNVEDDGAYQAIDIDLIWKWKNNRGEIRTTTIEIKGDRYYGTGNYFLETVSNKSKGTPGCFIYTQADYVLYYFVGPMELHVLPMPDTRNWFIDNINKFKERETSTPVGNGDFYITVGRLVPRLELQEAVNGVKIISLK
ncbi:hypothetical protein SH601_01310 [Gracilibacillus sp. S3-1-1]|uniref:Uncharacterized protein n=1 Tax=Gracilibacillus pellucidus TaxID=3095368 RepID=A0ACC6M136_9BACI|nr:hypothetical protein [Gracilibacillus sp. S3-1-1]MDX8044611.1 hypothetical protein [Gracilibacillus sp. S3-1-1]